jgi:hypothetical protein
MYICLDLQSEVIQYIDVTSINQLKTLWPVTFNNFRNNRLNKIMSSIQKKSLYKLEQEYHRNIIENHALNYEYSLWEFDDIVLVIKQLIKIFKYNMYLSEHLYEYNLILNVEQDNLELKQYFNSHRRERYNSKVQIHENYTPFAEDVYCDYEDTMNDYLFGFEFIFPRRDARDDSAYVDKSMSKFSYFLEKVYDYDFLTFWEIGDACYVYLLCFKKCV